MIKIKVKRGDKTTGTLGIIGGFPIVSVDGGDEYVMYGTTRSAASPSNAEVQRFIADTDEESNFFLLDDYGIDLNQDYKTFYKSISSGALFSGTYIGYVTEWTADLAFSLSSSGTEKYMFNFFNNTIDRFKVSVNGTDITDDSTQPMYYTFANDVLSVFTGTLNATTVKVYDFKMLKRKGKAGYVCLNSVSFGYTTIINEVKSTGLHEEINLLSDDLACNTFDFTAKFDRLNSISKDDKVYIYNNGINFGSYYVDTIERTAENIYKISCSDVMLRLGNAPFYWWSIYNQLSDLLTRLRSAYNNSFSVMGLSQPSYYLIKGKSSGANVRAVLCDIAYALKKYISTARNDDIVSFNDIPTEPTKSIKTSDRRILGQAIATKTDVITLAYVPFYGNPVFEYGEDKFYKDYIKSVSLPRGVSRYVLQFDDSPLWVSDWSSSGTQLPTGVTCVNKWYEDTAFIFSTTNTASTSSFNIIYHKYDIQPEFQSEIRPTDYAKYAQNEKNFDSIKVSAFLSDKPYAKQPNSHNVTTEGEEDYIKRDDLIQKYVENSRHTVKAKIVMQNEQVCDFIKIETAYDGVIKGIITSMDITMGFDNIADIEVLEWL